MKKRIDKANIIENKPYCKCGAIVGGIVDYNGAVIGCESYTRFVRKCSKSNCNNLSIYYADTRLEHTIRKTFNESDVTIIREK